MLCARKAAEDDRMHRADARAGQHGNGQLGHHAHINAYAVAFFHAIILQHIGKLHHLEMQVAVGEYAVMLLQDRCFPR